MYEPPPWCSCYPSPPQLTPCNAVWPVLCRLHFSFQASHERRRKERSDLSDEQSRPSSQICSLPSSTPVVPMTNKCFLHGHNGMFWDGQLSKLDHLESFLEHFGTTLRKEHLSLLVRRGLRREAWELWQPCPWLWGQGQCEGIDSQANKPTEVRVGGKASSLGKEDVSRSLYCLLFLKPGCWTRVLWYKHPVPAHHCRWDSVLETKRRLRWRAKLIHSARILPQWHRL